mmetsp:Transcript_38800/g.111425  ORF Transcript_38800/g.111425 Transcript_38800/m.111425 type:complete len:254 (-) Transcript_38800:919-1680(-)
MTLSTSRKLRPIARILSCTKPGIGVWRLPWATNLRFESAPRAAMFRRLGPTNFSWLHARRALFEASERRATSSSSSTLSFDKFSTSSTPRLLELQGSRSKQLTRRAPGYSMRTALAKPQRPACVVEPAFWASSSAEAKGCAPKVTIHKGGAFGALRFSALTRCMAEVTVSTSPVFSSKPSAKTTAAQAFSVKTLCTASSSVMSMPLPCCTQRHRLSFESASFFREASPPRTRNCSSEGAAGVVVNSILRHSTP